MLAWNTTSKLFIAVPVIIMMYLVVSFKLTVLDHKPVSRQQSGPTPIEEQSFASWMLRPDGYVRHCITGNIVGRVPRNFTAINFTVTSPLRETTNGRSKSFKNVFDKRLWIVETEANPDFKGPIASGDGSTIRYAQELVVILTTAIEQFKRLYGVRRVRLLDIPCGDFQWMSRFLMTRDDIDYTGVDIVPDLISSHKTIFADYHSWQFILGDIVNNGTDIIEQIGGFDIVVTRMMMQHLIFADVEQIFVHLSSLGDRSGSKSGRPAYVFATSFSGKATNSELDIKSPFRFRSLNLELPPISLTPPLCIARDGPLSSPHMLGLWMLPVRRVANCEKSVTVNATGFPFRFHSCVDWSIQ